MQTRPTSLPATRHATPAEPGRPLLPASLMPALMTLMCLMPACLVVSGCKLVDQRTFDADANRKPVPHLPHVRPGPPPPAPLAAVRFGAPPESWQPGLTEIARMALARKPEALFRVQTVVPAHGTPQAQAAALADVGQGNGRLVAQTIMDAGAASSQIEMTATSDASVTQPEVRVTVR